MMRNKLLIAKMGCTFAETASKEGDFEDWTRDAMEVPEGVVEVWDAYREEQPPSPNDFAGIVMTGSHAMVSNREAWSESAAAWLRDGVAQEVPFLGICYGHQLLAHACGGLVADHPAGREVGTVEIHCETSCGEDPLFDGLPAPFPAHVTHTQSALTLPPGAVVLAHNQHEPHHAFRLGACAWGVQFHPEFNESAMRDYIEYQREDLCREAQDPEVLIKRIRPTPTATSLLARFARWARKQA